jgi:RNA-directed DNA polymerase
MERRAEEQTKQTNKPTLMNDPSSQPKQDGVAPQAASGSGSEGKEDRSGSAGTGAAAGKDRSSAGVSVKRVLNEEMMSSILNPENLRAAYMKVKANKGAPGIDGIGVVELAAHVRRHWNGIQAKLEKGTYKPAPVRRVVIPKPGGGERKLGIPTTVDRLIQQAMVGVLDPIFDPGMSEHSYGFRRKRSAHDAVKAAQGYVHEGKTWVVDLDIKAFFDHVNHDILMRAVGQKVRDKTLLRLIGSYLRAGVLENGKVSKSTVGVPQGGPLSPLLANIYLDALDKELESRGVAFCRYADDITIYAGSERSAQRIYESIVKWIEKVLRLEVNREKSRVRPPNEGSFLGYRIDKKGRLDLSEKSLKRFQEKVREHFDNRRQKKTTKAIRDHWLTYLKGWYGYFRLVEVPWRFTVISKWIRRHVRKLFWQRWHKSDGRRNALRRLGLPPHQVLLGGCGRGAWRMAAHAVMHTALNNKRLIKYGFLTPSDLAKASDSEMRS